MLHAPPGDFIGKQHSDIMPPHIDTLFQEAFEKCRKGRPAEYEYALAREGETEHWQAKLSPMSSHGQFTGAVEIIRNITGIKRLELEIVETHRRERAEFGWNLHDSLIHELVAIECFAVALRKMLGTGRARQRLQII